MIIGEGSNILFTKNFEGLVIHLNIGGIVINKIDDDYRIVTAGAGENWHDLVIYCLKNGLGGIENLSLKFGFLRDFYACEKITDKILEHMVLNSKMFLCLVKCWTKEQWN